ncbi:1-acyl-sn-glycerol-3-phosphate acyltransferase [Aliikangiella marina]|uniref:1-acyl-sn-glycerol-3-phosphate acyltransferase n=1 Tax=Aliikangiella marina TaxID=1712262 RepID=A0A545TIL4_9GAMM|nr:lysophospholipid acyltransferase family protein [Aliikangiella marina]TQV77016.1 1-acyl-sn-glycerol-3-phosphate acyltransferase [Aliikangiella marina]
MLVGLTLSFIVALLLFIGHKNNQADWGHWGTNILDGLIRVYCRRFHRQGQQTIHIPDDPHVLLAPNHISGIDPFVLITATRRPIRFMIAKEEYDKPVLNWMFRAAGCIPVNRDGRVEKAFRSALRAIKAGELVSLFPQGGIHRHDLPREIIKPGIVRLSQLSDCHILPVRILGVGAPGTIAHSIIKRSNITFVEHPPVSPEQALDPGFREAMGGWLVGKRDKIV